MRKVNRRRPTSPIKVFGAAMRRDVWAGRLRSNEEYLDVYYAALRRWAYLPPLKKQALREWYQPKAN